MQGPWLLNGGTQGFGLLRRTGSPLKIPKMQTRPLRVVICACVALSMMTFLWHRMRAPMEKAGGLIASPPQHEDHPDGHAIVKYKNVKKLSPDVFNMNNLLFEGNNLHRGKDAGMYSETRNKPPHLGHPSPDHLATQISPSIDESRLPRLKKPSQPLPDTGLPSTRLSFIPSPKAKIAKVSMLHSSLIGPTYSNAMRTQEDHASLYGYGFHFLRREIMPSCRGLPAKCNEPDAHGLTGHWNKILYLQSVLIGELSKPNKERVDWLMWQDGDSITVNPSIPLDIFLPPSDTPGSENIHMLATKDDAGLNSGVFFLRVSPWSVRFLTACLAVPMTASLHQHLGWSYDQSAMARLLEENEEFKSGVVWQPRKWYNAYGMEEVYAFSERADYDSEIDDGRGKVLNMHFPGMGDDERIPLMEEWLLRLEEEGEWDAAPEETGLLEDIEEFWSGLQQTKRVKETKELRKAKQA